MTSKFYQGLKLEMERLDKEVKTMATVAAEWQLRRLLIESKTLEKVLEYARTNRYNCE